MFVVLNIMAAEEDASTHQNSLGKAQRKDMTVPEDYSHDRKGFTSLKVICLGDSAVGKSK